MALSFLPAEFDECRSAPRWQNSVDKLLLYLKYKIKLMNVEEKFTDESDEMTTSNTYFEKKYSFMIFEIGSTQSSLIWEYKKLNNTSSTKNGIDKE